MRLFLRGAAAVLLVGGIIAGASMPAEAQDKKDGDDISFTTVDGLRLFGTWYKGDRNSEVVIMLHGLGQNSQKGEWQTLAKALHAEGFAVLTFDMRGHGKSAFAKTFDDKKLFCNVEKNPHNKLCGQQLNPNTINALDYKRFNPGYFPFLIYDVAGARSFVDTANDGNECNSGKIYIIGDREMCSLGMFWMGSEFFRQSVNPQQGAAAAAVEHKGRKDLVGAVWISPRTPTVMGQIMQRFTGGEVRTETYDTLREKIGMAYVFAEGDTTSHNSAKAWFNQWRIKPDAKEDKELGKYMIEVKGAKPTMLGVDLLNPKLGVEKQIVEFMKQTKKKNIAGVPNTQRNPTALPVILPLEKFGFQK